MYVVTIFPYVMLTVLLVRGCTLEGAWVGIEFYLTPDFDRLTDGAVCKFQFLKLGQMTLSVCGIMAHIPFIHSKKSAQLFAFRVILLL